jgi:hypothetical protein
VLVCASGSGLDSTGIFGASVFADVWPAGFGMGEGLALS